MYSLTLHYDSSTTAYMQDINTFTFATELLLRGVYTEQPNDNTLLFWSESDRTYAVLQYQGSAVLEQS
jgi:hypothetical protein